ncbi:TPA: hypothetical protein ACV5IO_005620 [Pseudomonas aeruginosa]|uniref:hypothetical protein n=1 Tax=Pseudomonas aeruginosa TaxID=287 RepID=UPI0003BB4328|nr:hypothetical protein [Pseudomonas aeruginosa]ERZ09681.1 hypothetical protein Q007_06471 [Pseudomonas aeruginosa S54485]MCS8265462.1 hypothetical protein [Pseudomonas aeruginosa]MCV0921296.1 hypothetical protein [Escherichia coli]RPO67811.1 hypothetical protein IPC1180_32555 [Pseudomonas aeruginosa]
MNHHQKNQKPAQASSKANVEAQSLKSYRVEAGNTNPETRTEHDHLHDYYVVIDRTKANTHARNFWTAGYWVEVYDNETNELLAGPIDPDSPLPSYIV